MKKVIDIASDADVELSPSDISDCHHLIGRPKPNKQRPIIVRFVNRQKKKELMMKKKKLHDIAAYKRVI